MLKKMGWTQGEGLGKTRSGEVDPLTLDIKMDKKGKRLNYVPYIFDFHLLEMKNCTLTFTSRNFCELRIKSSFVSLTN